MNQEEVKTIKSLEKEIKRLEQALTQKTALFRRTHFKFKNQYYCRTQSGRVSSSKVKQTTSELWSKVNCGACLQKRSKHDSSYRYKIFNEIFIKFWNKNIPNKTQKTELVFKKNKLSS